MCTHCKMIKTDIFTKWMIRLAEMGELDYIHQK